MKSTVLSLALFLSSLSGMASAAPSPLALQQAKANNEFALDLYKQVGADGGNLFVSPYSVTSALAITYAGAAGQTASQMASALHYGGGASLVAQSFHELDKELAATDAGNGYTLSIANRIWTQKGLKLKPSFLQLVDSYYAGAVAPLDFQANPEGARGTINQWVEQQTNDKIKDLIPQGALDDLTRLVVTDAVYFKATWANPFDERFTNAGDFRLGTGETVSVPMMHSSYELRYAHDDGLGVSAVELPYQWAPGVAEPREVSLIALVPDRVDGLGALRSSLDAQKLDALIGQLQVAQVTLSFPKFHVESSVDAGQALEALGIQDLFDLSRANLSGILAPPASEQLFVSKVLHKTFINLNESGTEAAGATAVVIGATSVPQLQVTLAADHPFLYVIRDQATGTLLFVGQLADPRG